MPRCRRQCSETSTLLFWCLAPFLVDITKADVQAAVLFMCVGLLFPATVTLLNFEFNRLMGPNIAGAISGLASCYSLISPCFHCGIWLRYQGFWDHELMWPYLATSNIL